MTQTPSQRCGGYQREDGSLGHGGWCPDHGQHCLLCGEAEIGHDDAACDEKMAHWQPSGLLASFVDLGAALTTYFDDFKRRPRLRRMHTAYGRRRR